MIFQTPEQLHTFTTSDAERLPLLHVILKESPKAPTETVLNFLHFVPDLDIVCSNMSANGLKAGKHFPQEALAILCEAAKSDKNVNVVRAMLDAGTGRGWLSPGPVTTHVCCKAWKYGYYPASTLTQCLCQSL